MIKKKYKAKKGELPFVVLVHYTDKNGGHQIKITATEKAESTKNELIAAGMTEVRIPILEYRENEQKDV